MPNTALTLAPELAISEWFNTAAPMSLAALRGRPVYIHTFQLLCPGCVTGSIPQVQRIERIFSHTDLQVIGIHTVFEHHAAMTPVTLRAFLHEYRISHPVGVDLADDTSDMPVTMRRFSLRGTPSSVLIGRDGSIGYQSFGIEDDIAVGARIALALSAPFPHIAAGGEPENQEGCTDDRCEAPTSTR
ncbi:MULTISPECIES: TlpA family protein disulfide reductase [Mesorhizobium]|uniref:TlpA family protein disulfide reductase n=1 Tax=Mesorhizobium TaxID=68287 RepID=UPI0026B261FA